MIISEANRTYMARDVYRNWKRRVSDAVDSITVFSPFFDKLLLSLLKNTTLANDRIIIVTDLNPNSLLELPNQLLTLKRALSEGISVRAIPSLHAKVLLVDDMYIATGSQNFTTHGRKNKECTSFPLESMRGTRFLETLVQWREDATPIEEDFVDALISRLSPRIKQHKKLLTEVQTEFGEICQEHETEKQNALLQQLEELERQSRIRMSHGVVYASIESVYGDWGDYDSLLSDHGYDMTRWVIEKPGGNPEPYLLGRLSMYPMILAENNRMGFVRIGKTRITYIRKGINWTGRKLQVGDLSLSVEITFPDTDTKKQNIVVKLTYPPLGSCEAKFLFNGYSARLVRKVYFEAFQHRRNEGHSLAAVLDNHFFNSTQALNDFFRRFFTNFTYAELGRDNKNVRDYLNGTRFRLSVIQFQGNPFLVIKQQG